MSDLNKAHAVSSQLNTDKREPGASLFQMSIRPLEFKEFTHGCYEADAVWDKINGDASYEVSPLISDDSKPYAWEANYYTDNRNCNSYRVDPDTDEYPTKEAALQACQDHNRRRVLSIIEEMLT